MDGITLHAILHEASSHLPLRVQRIHQPDPFTLFFQLWSKDFRGQLLLSLSRSQPFLGFSQVKMVNPVTPYGFCLAVRRRLEGGVLESLSQEDLDRVAYLDFSGHDDLGNEKIYTLVFDGAGKDSNIGLIEDEKLILSMKPVDGKRFSLGFPYMPPDSKEKISLLKDFPWEKIREVLLSKNLPLENAILRGMAGFGKELSRCVAMDIPASDSDPQTQFEILQKSLEDIASRLRERVFEPKVYRDLKGDLILHVIPLKHLEVVKSFATCQEAAAYYCQEVNRIRQFQSEKRSFEAFAKKVWIRLNSRYVAKREDWRKQDKFSDYRLYGELLDASGKDLPAGLAQIEVVNYYKTPPENMTIPLDPTLSLKQNARKYYAQYKKLKRGRQILEKSLAHLEKGLAVVEKVRFDLAEAKNTQDLAALAKILLDVARDHRISVPQGSWINPFSEKPGKKTQNKESSAERNLKAKGLSVNLKVPEKPKEHNDGFGFVEWHNGFQFFYGRSSQENDYLYHRIRKPGDIWLHAKNQKGAHVLVRPPLGQEVTEEALLEGARIAAENSSARNASKVEVDYVDALRVNKPRGAPPGFVTFMGQKTIVVKPNPKNAR